jgi:hypothetical protein
MLSRPQFWCIAPGPGWCQEAVYQDGLLACDGFFRFLRGRPVLFGGRLDERREFRDDPGDYRLRLEQFGGDAGTLELAAAEDLVINLTRQYRFFHWHVEFPHIFRVGNGVTDINLATGWAGGFSCVIGNPHDRRLPQSSRPLAQRARGQCVGHLVHANV